jgi:hypothetical protein
MRVCLAFFGITRSLKYTIDSINKNIFDIFINNNIEYDVFVHTYKLQNYTNVRTRENKKDVDNNEYKLLKPDYVEIDDQNMIKNQINMKLYRTQKDPWKSKYNSVDNFILAQYSKYKIVKMIENSQITYDYILYVRPDCLYLKKININYLFYVNNDTICIPNFHLYSKYKINDRFCIANMNTYKIYGSIFPQLLELSKKHSLHSEKIIGMILKNNKIKLKKIPFLFSRVRCNGYIVDKFKL